MLIDTLRRDLRFVRKALAQGAPTQPQERDTMVVRLMEIEKVLDSAVTALNMMEGTRAQLTAAVARESELIEKVKVLKRALSTEKAKVTKLTKKLKDKPNVNEEATD